MALLREHQARNARTHRARSPFSIGTYAMQRAFLLLLIGLFIVYTVIHYLSTRHILAHCASLDIASTVTARAPTQVVMPHSTSDPQLAAEEYSWNAELLEEAAAAAEDTIPTKNIGTTDRLGAIEETPTIDSHSVALIGRVTMSYGALAEEQQSKLVLSGHKHHAELHGYSFNVLAEQVLHGLWSKHAYMLMLIVNQLARPKQERTQWFFWSDLDIVVMNPNVPLETFLPPDEGFSHINLVVSNDHNGLNNGAFFIRVSEWAVRYLADILALHTFKPDVKLKYSEQSAMEIMAADEKYANNTMYVPQRWFNAYRGPRDDRGQLLKGAKVGENTIKPGDLQLHFAGKKTKHLIPAWLDFAADESSGWIMPLNETKLELEVARFWKLAIEKDSWDEPVR